jgi:hypothetical protein
MHRKDRTIGWGPALVAAAGLVLSACGSSVTGNSTTTPSSGTTSPLGSPSVAAESFPIPNGTYKTTATRKEALAKGFTNKEIDHWYGPDGKQPLTIVLDNGAYHVSVVGDDGVEEVGDLGTYTATKKQWIPTSQAPGCPGCVFTLRWSFDGKVLSLKLVRDSAGPKDFRLSRLVIEHDYVKVG